MPTVSPDRITILSTPDCQRCKTVHRHLNTRGVEHDYIDLTLPENAALYEEFKSRGLTQVPQTFRGDSDWVEGVDFAKIDTLF
jgi:glutaredoxin